MNRISFICLATLLLNWVWAEEKTNYMPPVSFMGGTCALKQDTFKLIATQAEWDNLHDEIFYGEKAKDESKPSFRSVLPGRIMIDFERYMLVAIIHGPGGHCNGYSLQSFKEEADKITLQIKAHTFQSAYVEKKALSESEPTVSSGLPWGVFIIPKAYGKKVEVLKNVQHLIGHEPIWQPWTTLQLVKE